MTATSASSRRIITMSVMAATMLQALDTTIANVALPHMQGSLSAASDQVSWILTSYVVAAAIATAPTGYLTTRFGRKRVFLTAIAGFTIASMLCGIATSLPEMVIYRLMQGLFGAALVPLSQVLLLDANPPELHGKAMAMWGMGVMLGPILGPTLGGYLTETYNWRWAFYINLPVGVLAFLGLMLTMPDDHDARPRTRLDFTGFALLSIAIAALQLMLDRGQQLDWFDSREIVIECTVALLALYLFISHTLTAAQPFIPPRLFNDRNFVCGLGVITVVGIVMFATSALLPPFLQNLRGFPALTTGLAISPRGIGTLVAMWGVGRVIRHVDPRQLMLAGMLLTVASLAWMAHFNLDEPMSGLIGASILQGAGIGLVFVPLSTLTFTTLAAADRPDAASLYSLMRNVGSSLGIAGAFAYQVQMTQVNHAYLAEHVTLYNPALTQYMNAAGGLMQAISISSVAAELERQAAMLATIADFKVMMYGVLIATPLMLLFRRPAHMSAEPAEHAVID